MKKSLLLLFYLLIVCGAKAQVVIQQYASGFQRPCDLENCGDDRLFVVEQRGYIWILDKNGNKLQTPFLNIDPSVGSSGNEQGLLGLAFHPNYPTTPYFYVNYTDNGGDTHISRFTVSASDPNVADPNSEFTILTADQPYGNHNGGCVRFGPDGYLYIGLGDGGSGGDPQGNGQNKQTFLGKMLRIDVDNGSPYSVPADNPYVNNPDFLPEIWAYGLRNPWRYSFDALTGDLWIADVGQDQREEIDYQPATSTGGENYGWKIMEGNQCYPPSTTNCDMTGLTPPVHDFPHAGECSVTGGFVYRGFKYPQLYGKYLYTDYCSGKLWAITPNGSGGWTNTQIADFVNSQMVSFGKNKNGELFMVAASIPQNLGNIHRLVDNTETWGYTVNVVNPPCAGTSDGAIEIEFSANTPTPTVTWNDGVTGPTRSNLPAGTYTATIVGTNGSVATETVTISTSISVSSTASDVVCVGGQDGAIGLVVIGSQSPATATWSDGGTGLERIGLAAGQYSVTITTVEGCVFTQEFTLQELFPNPTPSISLANDSVLVANETYDSYNWLWNGTLIPGADDDSYDTHSNPDFFPGDYTLLVVDSNGCSGVSNIIQIEFVAANLIPEIQHVTVTPNPFSQKIRVEVTVSEPVFLELYLNDLQGKTLLNDRLAVTSTAVREYDLGKLPVGTYLLRLKNKKGEWVERLVKL